MRYVPIIVIAMLALISNIAYANKEMCYTPSPNLSTLGEAYYDVENASILSEQEENRVNAFFRELAGNWKGEGHAIECRGSDSAPQITSYDAILAAEARVDNTIGLSINANKHYVDNGIKKSESLSLLSNNFVFGLAFVNDNHLVFSEKYRRLNQPAKKPDPKEKTSTLKTIINQLTDKKKSDDKTKKPSEIKKLSRVSETIYNVILENGALIISRSYYTNGVFTGADSWRLLRD